EQDTYAITSYQRATWAQEEGRFEDEIIEMKVTDRKGNVDKVHRDEEPDRANMDKIPHLSPVFDSEGTVTAANASIINDGAAALLLMSREKADEQGIQPLARILSQSSAAKEPEWFTTAPSEAIPLALERAGLQKEQVDLFEINEAFAVVSLDNKDLMKLDHEKVNIHGRTVNIVH